MSNYLNLDSMVDNLQSVFDDMPDDFNRIEQIEYIEKNVSPFDAWIRLFLDYNYQVNNGGHTQYFDNGYHSTEQRGFMEDVNQNDDILQKFISLTKQFSDDIPCYEPLISILDNIVIEIDENQYDDCWECDNGLVEEYDDETEEYVKETCYECGGDGKITNPFYKNLTKSCSEMLAQLDSQLYSFNDALMVELDAKYPEINAKHKIV